ncbi:MAG: hypothetical protein NVS3B26_19100 [Mycobacteriales bacterium]
MLSADHVLAVSRVHTLLAGHAGAKYTRSEAAPVRPAIDAAQLHDEHVGTASEHFALVANRFEARRCQSGTFTS